MKEKVVNFRVIFYPFVAFMLGIIVAKRIFSGEIDAILISILLLGGVSAYLIYRKSFKPLIAIFAFFFIGNGFYYIGESTFNVKDYSGVVAVVGSVSDDIQQYSYACQVVLDDVSIDGEDAENLRLYITNCPKLKVGSSLTFQAEVEKSKPFTLKEFNSKDYRTDVRYNATVDYKDIVISDSSMWVDEIIRLDIKKLIYKNLSEENAGVAYAVMFGDKGGIDEETYSAYKDSGIIHVLTVSGLHVGFLVSLFYGFLKKCRVNNIINLLITTVIIIFYAYLCGFSPSVVRAGVMAICMMSARAIHRKYDSLNALGLAGFILCIIKPLTALDIGFLMSFFCVFAIIILNPTLTKFFNIFLPEKFARLIALSTSAQLGVLPFLALMGGSINLLSFAINIIVVPLFGVIYPYLFLVSFLGTFMPFLGVLLKLVEYFLVFVNKIAIFFGNADANLTMTPLGLAVTVIFFIILFFIGDYFMAKGVKKFALLTASFVVFVFSLCLYALPINSNFTTISCITSYGETSVVLSTKSGQTIVVGENSLLDNYKYKYSKDLDVYLSFSSISNEDAKGLNAIGINKFITCASYNEDGGGYYEIVDSDTSYDFADVAFTYLTNQEEVVGIIFIVDKHKIFVAKETNLSYNQYENIITKHRPEIVIAGEVGQLAKGEDYICVTNKHVEGCEYSYKRDGNLELAFVGSSWVKRGLD